MRCHAAALVLLVLDACAGSEGKRPTPPQLEESAPEERPGLGTSWGETRSSPVSQTAFARASSRPWAMLAVYYNDAEGLTAQIASRGGPEPGPLQVSGRGVTIWLADASGRVLPGVWAGDRPYVMGREGERYAVIIQNQTGARQEAVVTVDGLDVLDGHPGGPEKRGYVVAAGETVVIDGFRQSWDAVAAFRFGRVAESYAARTSGDRDVGVVGVALFEEAARSPWSQDEVWRRETADPFPGWR